jgi:hypothetical protein
VLARFILCERRLAIARKTHALPDILRRNDNKFAYAYLLRPKGSKIKLQPVRHCLVRKEARLELLLTTIVRLPQEVRAERSADAPDRPEVRTYG